MSITINLSKIRNNEGTSLSFNLQTEKLDLLAKEDLLITKPFQIWVEVKNTGNILQLQGEVETEVTTNCDRCLEKVILPIKTNFKEKLIHTSNLKLLHYLTKDEIEEEYVVFDKDNFDLTDFVRESIILAIPLKILCAENCRGFCPKCGQNLNRSSCNCTTDEIDPRLAILAKLKRD